MPGTDGYMDIQEFCELGMLQEVNRQFLYPLGLALEVVQAADGSLTLGGVWDSRTDPEGMAFGPDMMDDGKRHRVALLHEEHARARSARFGWSVQPIGEGVEDGK